MARQLRVKRESSLGLVRNRYRDLSVRNPGPSPDGGPRQGLYHFNIGRIAIVPGRSQASSEVEPVDDHFEAEAHAAAQTLEAGSGPVPSVRQVSAGTLGMRGVDPGVRTSIEGARGGGTRLPETVQRAVGHRLGADLSGVRVHTDARADGLNRQLAARAFTSGRDIFFRRGEYAPDNARGRSVLNHELTHVVQQCGPGSTRSAPSGAPIQRLILRLDADDGYTRGMIGILQNTHGEEKIVEGHSVWKDESPYHPTRTTSILRRTVTDTKLANLRDSEPLRIVAHGAIDGRVGGYTAQALFELLVRLGLPQKHAAGIDIHACLPASSLAKGGGRRQPTIVILQDLLRSHGYKSEQVRGYEHCIQPGGFGQAHEIESAGYSLFTKVLDMSAGLWKQDRDLELTQEQMDLIKNGLGQAGKDILAQYADDKGCVKKTQRMAFWSALSTVFDKSPLYHEVARLRRASSVRLKDIT